MMRYFKPRLLAGLFLILFTGCNPDGIFYDFMSFQGYKPGTVHDAPEEPFADVTSPLSEKGILQFFALGCAGAGNEGQRLVADSMAGLAADYPIDFVLYLGDNFYGRGVSSTNDRQWETKFESIYAHSSLQIPFYAVLGNHDLFRNPDAQVAYSALSKRWRMPARYYTFERELADGTRVQFFALDTTAMTLGEKEKQLEWLEENLKASTADWKIAYGHHPVYSGGFTWEEEIREMQEMLEPLFIQYGVDLYLSAHNHSIEFFQDIQGVSYLVSGAGSRPRDVAWIDATSFAHADLGFAWVRVFPSYLEIYIAGRDGQLLFTSRIPESR